MPSYLSPDELNQLNEKERRLTVAQYAIDYGRGGSAEMHRRYGMSRMTITKGMKELRNGDKYQPSDRIRKKGGGRKRKNDTDYPGLDRYILELVGNPSDPKMSLRRIAAALKKQYGIEVSYMTVSRTLEKYK